MRVVFYRQYYHELWITLRADEVLGSIVSNYLEDYNGTFGQISLKHMASGARFFVPMNEVAVATPQVPHDVFKGVLPLLELPDGQFQVETRLRDVLGNYTVLGNVSAPFGTERVIDLRIEVRSGVPQIIEFGAPMILLQGSINIDMPLVSEAVFQVALLASTQPFETILGSRPIETILTKD